MNSPEQISRRYNLDKEIFMMWCLVIMPGYHLEIAHGFSARWRAGPVCSALRKKVTLHTIISIINEGNNNQLSSDIGNECMFILSTV